MQREERRAGFAIESRHTQVGGGARGLALIASDTERLVDDEHVGGFAQPVLEQEG